jgi:hypothetical protein
MGRADRVMSRRRENTALTRAPGRRSVLTIAPPSDGGRSTSSSIGRSHALCVGTVSVARWNHRQSEGCAADVVEYAPRPHARTRRYAGPTRATMPTAVNVVRTAFRCVVIQSCQLRWRACASKRPCAPTSRSSSTGRQVVGASRIAWFVRLLRFEPGAGEVPVAQAGQDLVADDGHDRGCADACLAAQ